MHAAIYLRQSLDREGNMLAISRQKQPCVEKCREMGWEYTEYPDNDRSATRGERPQYQRMLTDIEDGKIDAIVVWDLDRLYRRPAELEHLIELADTRRLMLVTVTGEVDLSTHNGRLYARIKGAVARAEMDQKSARQKASHRQRAEAGKPWGNRRIFGFTEEMQLHPVEADAVRAGFDRFLAGGSLGSIARMWNDLGLTTTLGNAWKGPGVRQFIVNPKLAGLISYNGEVLGPGEWPGIVDEETWRAVCAILADPKRKQPGSGARKYLMTGIALCGKCNDGKTTLGSGHTAWKSVLYRCNVCHGIGRSQVAVDRYVTKLAVGRLSRKDAKEMLVDRDREGVGELSLKAAKLRGKLEALEVEFADEEDETLTAFALKSARRITAELQEVERQMADADKARIFRDVIDSDNPAAAFAAAGLDRQREMVATMMRVTVLPTRKGAGFRPDDIKVEWLE